jgi:hypothetical protein
MRLKFCTHVNTTTPLRRQVDIVHVSYEEKTAREVCLKEFFKHARAVCRPRNTGSPTIYIQAFERAPNAAHRLTA